MHSHIQTKIIDTDRNVCILKPYFLSISQSTGKIYSKWLRVKNIKSGQIMKITTLDLNKPSEELRKHYEEMKERFVRTLISDLDDQNLQEDQQKRNKLKPLNARQQEVFDYLNIGKTTNEIAELMDLPASTISSQKNYIINKGYIWKIPKKHNKKDDIKENP